jgi:hypothetical protein
MDPSLRPPRRWLPTPLKNYAPSPSFDHGNRTITLWLAQ